MIHRSAILVAILTGACLLLKMSAASAQGVARVGVKAAEEVVAVAAARYGWTLEGTLARFISDPEARSQIIAAAKELGLGEVAEKASAPSTLELLGKDPNYLKSFGLTDYTCLTPACLNNQIGTATIDWGSLKLSPDWRDTQSKLLQDLAGNSQTSKALAAATGGTAIGGTAIGSLPAALCKFYVGVDGKIDCQPASGAPIK